MVTTVTAIFTPMSALLKEFIQLVLDETSATTGIETTTHAFWLWSDEPVKNYPYKGMHHDRQWANPPEREKVNRPSALDQPSYDDVLVPPFTKHFKDGR